MGFPTTCEWRSPMGRRAAAHLCSPGSLSRWARRSSTRNACAPCTPLHHLTNRLHAQAPDGETVETELDLADVSSLQELQDLVAEEWRELVGGTMSSSLKMEYEDEDGDFVKVSRSTPIEEVTASPAIRFLRSKGTGRQHRYEM